MIHQWIREKTRPWRRRLAVKARLEAGSLFLQRQWGRLKRKRVRCPVIGVTGSSGKSTTVVLLDHILADDGRVEGLLINNTLPALTRFLSGMKPDCDFVVAEMGATKPGYMRQMSALLRPDVAIVTKVGLEHYSAFRSREAVATEKGALVESLPESGLAILNVDDPHVLKMSASTNARVVTFGWSDSADYQVIAVKDGLPSKLRVTIRCPLGIYECATPFLDSSFWLATAAAFACAVELGMAPERVAARIETAVPIWNRLQLLQVEDGPAFLVDSVKAPAESIEPTLAVLGKAKAPYKTLILGMISDYAGNPRKQYRSAYRQGQEVADRIIFVGDQMHRAPATEDEIQSGAFAGFLQPIDVARHIRETARPGELVLIKGSRNLHLERIALEWFQPVECWEQRCGKSIDCLTCGMVGIPYARHGEIRRAARRDRLKFWRGRSRS